MRIAKLTFAMMLGLEALLGLAFLAGMYGFGDWRAGVVCCAGVLLLVCIPWLGDLVVDYDSGPASLRVAFGWWGRVMFEGKANAPQVRVLGIGFRPQRKQPPALQEEPAAGTARPKALEVAQWAGENFDGSVRLLLASLQASHELLWGSKDLRVKMQSPVQTDWADLALAMVIRDRKLGPLQLECTAPGERRVCIHYRTTMLSAGLIGLALFAEGRPRQMLAAWKREQEPK